MPHVIRILGLATGQKSSLEGQYLRYYDPSAHDGRGEIRGTPDVKKAIQFESPADAMYTYRLSYGTRTDGKPNRPLTAYTVEIKPV